MENNPLGFASEYSQISQFMTHFHSKSVTFPYSRHKIFKTKPAWMALLERFFETNFYSIVYFSSKVLMSQNTVETIFIFKILIVIVHMFDKHKIPGIVIPWKRSFSEIHFLSWILYSTYELQSKSPDSSHICNLTLAGQLDQWILDIDYGVCKGNFHSQFVLLSDPKGWINLWEHTLKTKKNQIKK